MTRERDGERGTALFTVLMLMALLMSMLVGYFSLTYVELKGTRSSMDSLRGYYAAEAGLNLRADAIRQTFEGYNRPSGTSPTEGGTPAPCDSPNYGSGDFACVTHNLVNQAPVTYVNEAPGNPTSFVVPRGEPFQNLMAQAYTYDLSSTATSQLGRPAAVLAMRLKSMTIPLFQFAAFYNKDLEILPGPAMTLSGPVHTNGDLYLDAGTSLDVFGQVTTSGDLYHGRKEANACNGPVRVIDPVALRAIPACSGGRVLIDASQLGPWNDMIRVNEDPVTVPAPEALDPTPGMTYWDRADLRLQMVVGGGPAVFEVRNPDDSVDAVRTAALNASCGTAVTHSTSLYNHREAATIEMMDVDLRQLFDCIYNEDLLIGSRPLDDTTEGGLVFHFGVEGAQENVPNNYGVRVREGDELRATSGLAPEIRGLTVVTNQALYVEGHYNRMNKKPAAFLADSLNVLSESWNDANSAGALGTRVASNTTIHAAFLAGTDSSGGLEGPAGQNSGNYNGGLENYPRFHENWSTRTLTYRGSFVSLNLPQHVDGAWSSSSYSPPIRDWDYDVDFNDAANLPPLTPRFVYLRQQLFVRQFEL